MVVICNNVLWLFFIGIFLMKKNAHIKIQNINFSYREIDVLSCLIHGRSAKSMALLLAISTNTVNSHIKK